MGRERGQGAAPSPTAVTSARPPAPRPTRRYGLLEDGDQLHGGGGDATPPKTAARPLSGGGSNWGWGLGVGWEGRVGWGAGVTTSPFTGSLRAGARAPFLPSSRPSALLRCCWRRGGCSSGGGGGTPGAARSAAGARAAEGERREAVSERRLAGREREGGRKAEGYSGRTSPRRHRAPRPLAAAEATRNLQLVSRPVLKGGPAPIRPRVSRPGVG